MKKSITALALVSVLSITTINAVNNVNFELPLTFINSKKKISPICEAAAKGDIVKVKQLIKSGVNVNKKSNGMQPIHYAARHNRVEIIKLLVTAGSHVHARSDKGYTAKKYANLSNAKEAEALLHRLRRYKS